MPEDHKSADEAEDAVEESTEPLNRAERRALKNGKKKTQAKGVGAGSSRIGFSPKEVKVAGHKEFSNRKSG